jgi:hypothetical protein
MAGNEYNQVRPHQAQDRTKIAAGSPLAVLGLLLEALRERFAEGNGLDIAWRPDVTTTDILIEIGYNAELQVRDFGRAVYINRLNTVPKPIAVGDRAGVRLPDHLEGFIAEMTSQFSIDCVSNDKGDSMVLADIVQHFLLAVGNIMEAQYGIHDFGMPELGQTAPFEHDQKKFSTSVSFSLSYHVRWSTVKIRPLLQQVSVTAVDAEALTETALSSISRGLPVTVTQVPGSTPTGSSGPQEPLPHAPTHRYGGDDVLIVQDLGSGDAALGVTLFADGLGGWTLSIPAGGGDVVSPSPAVSGNIMVFVGPSGKIIGDGGVTVASLQGPRTPVSYTHTQNAAATEWIINHNLGYQPVVDTYTLAGVRVEMDVVHVTLNQARVYSAAASTGVARCL